MREIGIVAENEALSIRLPNSPKFLPIEIHEFLPVLDRYCDPSLGLLPSDKSQVSMGIATPRDALERALESTETMRSPFYAYYQQSRGVSPDGSRAANRNNAAVLFRQSRSAEEQAAVVVKSLSDKLARALSIEAEDIDTRKPLHAFGVDSLVAVELRNWIAKEFASDIPIYELTGGKSILKIGEVVVSTSQLSLGSSKT
jgi:acyl carrier protein